MSRLLSTIDELTDQVVSGETTLDEVLTTLDRWLAAHAPDLTADDRDEFSAALSAGRDAVSSDDARSLVDSVITLHATRLLYRHDNARHSAGQDSATEITPGTAPETGGPTDPATESPYEVARTRFARRLRQSEEAVNEARIDIAIANAHHLLHDAESNRRWLDSALNALPDLANVDLVALADEVPSMPVPEVRGWRRIGLKLIGFPFARLAASNRENLLAIARLQMSQVAILAHLLGTSFEAIRERQRARRAFRIIAHLVNRYDGLPALPPDQLIALAEDLQRFEIEAAQALARQVRDLCIHQPPHEADCATLLGRVEALLAREQ